MESVTDRAFAAALYSEGDAGLDTGASLLAADPAADAELGRRRRGVPAPGLAAGLAMRPTSYGSSGASWPTGTSGCWRR